LNFLYVKNALDPYCNNHNIFNVIIHHISSQILASTILVSLSLCISTVLDISLINRNCVLLYICASCYIYDICLLYYFLSFNIFVYFFVISPLAFCAKNSLD
jgi:hypothetical protein